jgi:Flp pilus assembly protein TadD
MKFDKDLMQLLMEMGFLASNTGRLKHAATIFGGVASARPNSAYPQIGLGCVAMGYGEFAKAAEMLRNAPATERAERELCNGFLGMALKLDGNETEYHSVLTQLVNEGENEVAVRMAEKLLAQE